MNLAKKEQIEIDYWKNSPFENPKVFTKENFLNKAQELKIFNYKVYKHLSLIRGKTRILELGAGQGWASCYLKRYFLPKAHFTTTDISEFSIESIKYWEAVFNTKIDQVLACRSYAVPLADQSFDLIFCFAAAHHFVKIEETLQELKRLLKPRGVAIFFYEPTCSKYLYPLHFRYVNKFNPHIPEDVFIPKEVKKIADQVGLTYRNIYDAKQPIIRSLRLGLYFRLLKNLPFLQAYLPSSSDMIFTKEA